MPKPGHRWWHLILTTRGSWLPGDPRGFRSREHRVHSSGDYKHRPPVDEHAGLHHYQVQHSADAIRLTHPQQAEVGCSIIRKTDKQEITLAVLAVTSNHLHALVEIPHVDNPLVVMRTWKQTSSHRLRASLPGRVWARGGKPILVNDASHHAQMVRYIRKHRDEGAWVWDCQQGVISGG